MTHPNPKAEFFFAGETRWPQEIALMRQIALACDLDEAVKWGCPCYTHQGRNITLIHTFKDYAAFLFFKGALMVDDGGLLVQQTANVQAARQIRLTSAAQVAAMDNVLKSYIHQAIALETSGAKVPMKTLADFTFPDEFLARLQASPILQSAFDDLTPGRRKGYSLYFNAAKQSKTREARIEKSIPRILAGKGPDDPD